MSTRLFPLSQPVGRMKNVCDIKIASKMDDLEWRRLRDLVQTIASKFLDTGDMYELQDPERVRMFYRTFHSKWPEIPGRYHNSWVLVRYLKMYLQRRAWKKRGYDRKVHAVQAREKPRQLRTVQDAHYICSDTVSSRRSETLASSSSVQSPPTIFQFLQSTKPSLVKLVPDFIAAGIHDQDRLEDFLTWPAKAQRDFLLKTFNGKMNALELGALVIALDTRRGYCVP